MASLATLVDYENMFGDVDVDIAQQVQNNLATASEAVRRVTGQTLDQVTDDTVTIRGTFGTMLTLPERPVTSVTSVTLSTPGVAAAQTVTVDVRSTNRLWRSAGWGGPHCDVTVVYTHGFDPVPPDVVGIVCKAAARAINNPAGALQSVAVGESYRVTFAGTANDQVGVLTRDEVAYLRDAYRPRW